jgi:hypothetical protein
MKLRICPQAFGPKFTCIDESEHSGLIGQGDTEQEARRDFWDQWLNRESLRDMQRAKSSMDSWDQMMRKLCGLGS